MKRTTFAAIAALSSVSLVGSVGCEGGQGTGARALPVSSQASVEDTPVAVAGADAGGAGAASAVCGVTLVATLVFHGSQTLDGTASLAQPIPFAIPASIPVTTGGTKNGSAQLQFSAGGGAPVTCSYELHGGGQSFPLSGCDNGASAGGLESADSFMLHIRTADHGAGTSGTEIQLTAVLDAPDGTVCRGSDECFQAYACQSGTCTGSNPVTCTASDQCHTAGTCDPSSGTCSNPSAPDGTACSDGNRCDLDVACEAGVCTAGAHVTCPALDQCHLTGTCDSSTGQCSNPIAPEGTACNDGNLCTVNDTCVVGVCMSGTPVSCTPSDDCHLAGTCQPRTGRCSNPTASDGVACGSSPGSVCYSGACDPGCYIAGTLYSEGASGPGGCQSCQPVTSTSEWTTWADGTNCISPNNNSGNLGICSQGSCQPCGSASELCCDFGGAPYCYQSDCVGGTCQCGGQDQECCNGTSGCGPNLECLDTSGASVSTCQCGGQVQPCCGGNSCGPNLTCSASYANSQGQLVYECNCGTAGSACCGGNYCDAYSDCTNGMCVSNGIVPH